MLVDPALAARLREQTSALRETSADPSRLTAAIASLRSTLTSLDASLAKRGEREGDGLGVARAIDAMVSDERPLPYTAAEATTMGLSTLLLAEHEAGHLDQAAWAKLNRSLDEVYALLRDESRYDPEAFAVAVAALGRRLGR